MSARFALRWNPSFTVVLVTLTVTLAGCSDDTGAQPASGGTGVVDLSDTDITLTVGVNPGGGQDAYARMIGPYLARQLNTSLVVENKPGAGTLVALNELVNADVDGSHLMLNGGPAVMNFPITQPDNTRYKADQLTYLGSVASEPALLYARKDAPFASVDDILARGTFKGGSPGVGSQGYQDLAVLFFAFGLPPDIVAGYQDTGETTLGMIRGEIDAQTATLSSALTDIEANGFKPIAVLSEDRSPTLPDVPTIFESTRLKMNATQESVLRTHIGVLSTGRIIVGPPGMPQNVVDTLRAALRRALEDPGLIAEAQQRNMPVEALDGAQLQTRIQTTVSNMPSQYIDLISQDG